jgi:hypothetical protein
VPSTIRSVATSRSSATTSFARLDELTIDGSASPDFDENFADSAQVAAELGENLTLAAALREQLNDVEGALTRLSNGNLRKLPGVRRGHQPSSAGGHASDAVLHHPRLNLSRARGPAPGEPILRVSRTRR